MAVLMELSRILIRELVDHQIIELREVDPGANGSTAEEIDDDPSSIFGDESEGNALLLHHGVLRLFDRHGIGSSHEQDRDCEQNAN